MKIHYLVTSLETGGAEFAIPDIVGAMQRLGHDVRIIACEPRDMGAASRLDAAGLPYTVLCHRRRHKLIVLAAYMKRLLADRPDVIWTSLSWGTRIGQMAGCISRVPVVSFKHSASVRPATYRMRNLSRLWIGDSQTVVCFIRDKMHIPANNIMVWPFYCCNLKAPAARPWDGTSVLRLGSVGRLHEVKNYDVLIEGIALFVKKQPQWASRIHLTILGDGPLRRKLEHLIAQLGLSDIVSLPGHSDDVESFLASQHVYTQPSRYEGMCLAAHEAMNSGLPIIATPVGELQDCVQEGKTGFLLKGDVAPALCDVLERIFAEPAILHEYGEKARRHVQATYSREAFNHAAEAVLARISLDIGKQ